MRTHIILLFLLAFAQVVPAQQVVQVSHTTNVSKEIKGTSQIGRVVISNLNMLNSSDMDYSPILYQDGIVFTSTRKHKGSKKKWFKNYKKEYSYLFFSKKTNRGEFRKPQPLKGNLNGRYHEGAATFNASGTLMFFTRNTSEGKNRFGKINLKIYMAKNVKGYWKEIKELPFNSDRHSTCHPSLSADGKRLYFASNRYGGFGGMDIYVSYFEDGKWQYPINLGPEVNSAGNETFPFIDENDELYFSSDGHGGEGGLDIFKTSFKQTEIESWNEPVNIGQPFNSEKDDFGFTIYNNSQEGFFTSSREGGLGRDDIYTWRKAYLPQADDEIENPGIGQINRQQNQNNNPVPNQPVFISEIIAVLTESN